MHSVFLRFNNLNSYISLARLKYIYQKRVTFLVSYMYDPSHDTEYTVNQWSLDSQKQVLIREKRPI